MKTETLDINEPELNFATYRQTYLRSYRNYFVFGNVKTTDYGIQSIKYLASKIW